MRQITRKLSEAIVKFSTVNVIIDKPGPFKHSSAALCYENGDVAGLYQSGHFVAYRKHNAVYFSQDRYASYSGNLRLVAERLSGLIAVMIENDADMIFDKVKFVRGALRYDPMNGKMFRTNGYVFLRDFRGDWINLSSLDGKLIGVL